MFRCREEDSKKGKECGPGVRTKVTQVGKGNRVLGSGIHFEEIEEFGALHRARLGILPRESVRAAQVVSPGQHEQAGTASQTPLDNGGGIVVDIAANSLEIWPETARPVLGKVGTGASPIRLPLLRYLGRVHLARPPGGSERAKGLSAAPSPGSGSLGRWGAVYKPGLTRTICPLLDRKLGRQKAPSPLIYQKAVFAFWLLLRIPVSNSAAPARG